MKLINPHTGKSVEASGDVADRLIAAGFRAEPSQRQEPVKRKPGRPKKS